MGYFLVFLLLTTFSQASDVFRAPPAFKYLNSQAVFVDFQQADYQIFYDAKMEKASYSARITFQQQEAGHPLFDLVEAPVSIKLNQEELRSEVIHSPDQVTKFRVLSKSLVPGFYTLEISGEIKEMVTFDKGNVRSAFWTSDLEDRSFLEQYLPANLEYDEVQMSFEVQFLNIKQAQLIYTNGQMEQISSHHFKIHFPAYFNASSIYFHTVPEGVMHESRFSYKSRDGRDLPVTIYFAKSAWSDGQNNMNQLIERTQSILKELEDDYGPFPHPSITIYNAGLGGMEYCGATMTELRALGHELTHSYFARGVMPLHGNSGWIDEALASWRDDRYPTLNSLTGAAAMASRSVYQRDTDRRAYTFGADFMAYLDGKFKAQGGLKSALRVMADEMMFKKISTDDFISLLEKHFSQSVMGDFNRYVRSKNQASDQVFSKRRHDFHQKMSRQSLKKFL